MDYSKEIMEMANANGGYVTSFELTKKDIPRIYLKLLVNRGHLEKSDRGVYILPNVFDDEMFNLQSRFKRGIFSHETSLFLHDLTDRTPKRYTMTFPAGYNTTTAKRKNIITYYSINERYELGITKLPTSFGAEVRVYNSERTLCDLLQKRSKTDVGVLTEAIKRYVWQSNSDIPRLSEYAKIFQVEMRLRPYLEVLL